ncbi:hypothetical protein HYH02_006802 [Chlamydomonas schloesseri]|uniref:DUF962 domain-containing protein n=1 Tax=Chlamydomonas schloesseri TaxID=2026947 RepID=A0A835WIX1_9CHLO|nr:hypothetical protein HYH02_006802 [Chlamydomonas schloesseri]|eukprot:KAG2448217.1 hypothetical protein HYH02_006802 [Chlamydomonas schloesseri]
MASAQSAPRFKTFAEFYPFYQSQHRHRGTRSLHLVGTGLALLTAVAAVASRRPRLLLLAPVLGYGPAWASHALVERNRPATFRYPLWSLLADLRMFVNVLTGREPLAMT